MGLPVDMRWACAAIFALPVTAFAQQDEVPAMLDHVVVTATRDPGGERSLPASVDAVARERSLGEGRSLPDWLRGVAGLAVRDRQNPAQDLQLAIRGFGARSSFGIRGLRLYVDGIPATQPDGQGQVTHFPLDAAERIEVLRGPFSALYGNSSGGVVQLFSAPGAEPDNLGLSFDAGGHGLRRAGFEAQGISGRMDYRVNLAGSRSDGLRPQSAAERRQGYARLGFDLGEGASLTLLGNVLDQPLAQDPLGLSWREFEADPHATTPAALQYDTRKTARQSQLGAVLQRPLGEAATLHVMVYGGARGIRQYLAIPPAAQANPRHAGGVIDLSTQFGGGELRLSRRLGEAASLQLGVSANTLAQDRRGYENFAGARLGVIGALRRDERIHVRDADAYAQLDWTPHPRWRVLAGLRHSRIRMRVDDRFVTASNPDDGGEVAYSRTTPVFGASFQLDPRWHVYASVGSGFETPTITELAYRADGGSGLAFDLRPARSRHWEVGAKRDSPRWRLRLALFGANTRDELAVATSAGGRSTYRNATDVRRRGIEASADWRLSRDLDLSVAATWLEARFVQGFLGCSERCTQPDTPIAAGTRIPGVAARQGALAVAWRPLGTGLKLAADLQAGSRVGANDAGTAQAPGFAVAGLEAAYGWHERSGGWNLFVRVDNVTGRRHVGSVIVNDGNARYFEPGAPRSWRLGLRWNWR